MYSPPDFSDVDNIALCAAALDAGTVGAYVTQMPNQPLYFAVGFKNRYLIVKSSH